MTSDLEGLLQRVMGAQGPDREIDAEMARALGYNIWQEPVHNLHGIAEGDLTTPVMSKTHDGTEERRFFYMIPAWSASIDAAVAFAELVLPGWEWAISKNCAVLVEPPGLYIGDFLSSPSATVAKTTPLAIIAATLKALIVLSLGESRGDRGSSVAGSERGFAAPTDSSEGL